MKARRSFIFNLIVKQLPSTRCFAFKRKLLRWAGAEVGENVRIASNSSFLVGGLVSIGRNTWIGTEALLIGGNSSISIGENCDIAPRVTFACGTHEISPDEAHVAGDGYSLPIVVERGCWIGVGATILGGTRIGERSVVAAGAVVKGDFPRGCLIGGVPARVLRASLDKSSTK